MLRTLSLLVVAGLLFAPSAQAIITGVNNGGVIITAPSDVTDDAAISLNAAGGYAQNGFNERQGVLLGAPVGVDGGSLPPGIVVSSHMIFLNTVGNTHWSHINVQWTFDGAVLGVMSDVGGTLEAASSALLGAPGTIYPGAFANRGLEGSDSYLVAANAITVTMGASEPGDWIRVVTASERGVPEPGTLLLLGTGLAGAGWIRRRRARK